MTTTLPRRAAHHRTVQAGLLLTGCAGYQATQAAEASLGGDA
ncbi:hypothetical protein ACIHEI_36625 [Kitasatospora sp. NPDC051984]